MAQPVPPADNRTFQIDVVNEARVEKYRMDFGNADRLSAFGGYRFFTPAILYRFGGITDNVWVQLMAELGRDVTLMFRKFDQPLFRGLETPNGDHDWNHALWAVKVEDWDIVENYLISVTFMDQESRRLHKIGAQDVRIVDPLNFDRRRVIHADSPFMDVVVFGINGNLGRIAFQLQDRLDVERPKVHRFPPDPKVVRFADALFGKLDPTQAVNLTE